MSRVRALQLFGLAHVCSLLGLLGFAVAGGMPSGAPLAWAGGRGMPMAWLFNGLVWLGPGLLVAWGAAGMRAQMPRAGLAQGIALRLCLLAALAFAAQGLLPLDPTDLDAGGSRLHATAWMLWQLAFVAAIVVSGLSLRAMRWPGLVIGAAIVFAPRLLGPELGQCVVLAGWWGWTLLLAARLPLPR